MSILAPIAATSFFILKTFKFLKANRNKKDIANSGTVFCKSNDVVLQITKNILLTPINFYPLIGKKLIFVTWKKEI